MLEMILLYNTLAFSTQCVVGQAADRLRRHSLAASLSMLLIVLGFALPLGLVFRVCLVGMGNSVFHVAGGVMTLERCEDKAGKLGVFVAPGVIGLTLGSLWPRLGTLFAILLALCAFAVIPLEKRSPAPPKKQRDSGERQPLLVPLLLAMAVGIRALGGSVVSFPWNGSAAAALLLSACVFAGKTAGGFLCDNIGAKRTAAVSMLSAAILIAFCSAWEIPSLIGQLLLNLSMPIASVDLPGHAGSPRFLLWIGRFVFMARNHPRKISESSGNAAANPRSDYISLWPGGDPLGRKEIEES
jgi:FSR family fosmidomycin resistance protein-like MFS transporter